MLEMILLFELNYLMAKWSNNWCLGSYYMCCDGLRVIYLNLMLVHLLLASYLYLIEILLLLLVVLLLVPTRVCVDWGGVVIIVIRDNLK